MAARRRVENTIGGMTLRQAALIAGFAYLLNPVSYVEFHLYPQMVVAGNVAQTVANIGSHGGTFVAIVLGYLLNFIEDVVLAWALYVLLAPVNQALSLLTAWLRLIYTAMGLFGLMNLVVAYRMVHTPEYLAQFGANGLNAQVDLLLHSFRYDWGFSLIVFGVQLCLLGCLLFISGYTAWISKVVGALVILAGLGWIVMELQPYLYPKANIDWVFFTSLGELVFMLWLLIAGWRLKQPETAVFTKS
jgi:Domain of unknown function (DUF4386)